MAGTAVQKVGVEMVVEKLSEFLAGMNKADQGIKSLVPTTGLLGSAFNTLKGIASGLANFVSNTLSTALGVILRDAFNAVMGAIKGVISRAIEATNEFQHLEVRLNRLNFNQLTKSGMEAGKALEYSTKMTKEQLVWILKLAATTPFSPEDIADVYTMARAYGFTADEAKDLTKRITDFASGMGLTEQHIKRIITNFGQMISQGKITGMELRDLARGAFVPVNDILERMAKSIGVTTAELADGQKRVGVITEFFKKMATAIGMDIDQFKLLVESGGMTKDQLDKISKATGFTTQNLEELFGKGLNGATLFFQAFSQMVDEDFEGAATDMNRVLQEAIENVDEFFRGFIALGVLDPIFKQLSTVIVQFMDAIVAEFDNMWAAFKNIGESIAWIIGELTEGVDAKTFAHSVLAVLEGIGAWLSENKQMVADTLKSWRDWLFGTSEEKGAIEKFFDWVMGTVYPFIRDTLLPGLKDMWGALFGTTDEETGASTDGILRKIYDVAVILSPLLGPLVELLGALAGVIISAFGGTETQAWGDTVNGTLVPAIQDLTKYLNDNNKELGENLAWVVKALFWWELFANVILKPAASIIGLVLSFKALNAILALCGLKTIGLGGIWTWLSGVVGTAATALGLSIGGLFAVVIAFIAGVLLWTVLFRMWFAQIKGYFDTFKEGWKSVIDSISKTVDKIKEDIKNKNWSQLGKDIIQGIVDGVGAMAQAFTNAIVGAVVGGLNVLRTTIGLQPLEIGKSIIGGVASGVAFDKGELDNELKSAVDGAYEGLKDHIGGHSPSTMFMEIGASMAEGMAEGIVNNAGLIISAAIQAAWDAFNAAMSALGAGSPSRLFMKVGDYTMQGMAIGIERSAGMAVSAMSDAVGKMTMPAMSAPSMAYSAASMAPTGNTYSTSNEFTMNINTSANSEPIMQDFAMMESLAGI